jgi:hypothetical protein
MSDAPEDCDPCLPTVLGLALPPIEFLPKTEELLCACRVAAICCACINEAVFAAEFESAGFIAGRGIVAAVIPDIGLPAKREPDIGLLRDNREILFMDDDLEIEPAPDTRGVTGAITPRSCEQKPTTIAAIRLLIILYILKKRKEWSIIQVQLFLLHITINATMSLSDFDSIRS